MVVVGGGVWIWSSVLATNQGEKNIHITTNSKLDPVSKLRLKKRIILQQDLRVFFEFIHPFILLTCVFIFTLRTNCYYQSQNANRLFEKTMNN